MVPSISFVPELKNPEDQKVKRHWNELEQKGYITVSGRVSAKYACERLGIEEIV